MNSLTRKSPRHRTQTPSPSLATLAELRAWSDAGHLPELIPSRQDRGMRAALAMLDSGVVLLRDRSLDALSIEAVCRQANATVGAFYARFDSKRNYFLSIERVICLRARMRLEGFSEYLERAPPSLERFCDELVSQSVMGFRLNAGVFRAALLHSHENMWTLLQQAGDDYRRVLGERLAPLLTHVPRPQRATRVQFAFTALIGTMVHILLNAPGPVALADEALERELARLVTYYLRAPG